jgi:protein phosphatase
MKLISWSITDVGRKRDHNEDSFVANEELGLYVVADGMGGHLGGDQASRMAVDILQREIGGGGELEEAARRILEEGDRRTSIPDMTPPVMGRLMETTEVGETTEVVGPLDTAPGSPPPAAATVLRAAARVAGRSIFDTAQADARLAGMGTTLTAMLVHKGRVQLAHVGDSRAFLYRDGKIAQITEDHSWIAEQIRAGIMTKEEARDSKFRHIITRSVGFEREVDVDLTGVPIQPGDCFVLCSDGMSNYVDNDELGRILATTYYRKIPRLLVELANDRGGDDNITVVVVYAANERV